MKELIIEWTTIGQEIFISRTQILELANKVKQSGGNLETLIKIIAEADKEK